jgi:excisionase family DNA binding protein
MSALTFYTLDEVADMLKVSRDTLERQLAEQEHLARRIGRQVRMSASDVEKLWKSLPCRSVSSKPPTPTAPRAKPRRSTSGAPIARSKYSEALALLTEP